MKTWTYEEITQIAEDGIRNDMESMQSETDAITRSQHRCRAGGRYLLWRHLTNGSHLNSDDARIMALIYGSEPT